MTARKTTGFWKEHKTTIRDATIAAVMVIALIVAGAREKDAY